MARRKAENASTAQEAAYKALQKAEAGELIAKDGRRMSPKSVQNLRPAPPLNQRPEEEAKAIHQAGQKASTQVQAKRRTIREIYNDLLELPAELDDQTPEDLATAAQQMAQQKGKTLTVYESIAVAMAARARAGDVKAAAFVRDSAGDKPTDQVQVTDAITEGDRALLAKLSAMSDQETD